ncbi:isoform mocs1a of molybdenum cofactor biosynthesis protein 1 [Aspergillus udagawae]|nr:isoform mocs1a of molybdenum cofactor biosynthesis protein 1 [Aspergillus udagawae]
MPEDGVALSSPPHLLTTPEIIYLSSLFVSQGVTKIRLTGGEPTVRSDFLSLMREIGKLRHSGLRELCLTSNALTLSSKLDSLVDAGLTGINISLDTLDPFQFQIMTRRKGFEKVMNCIQRIIEMNRAGANVNLKINCVVLRGLNDGQIIPFVEFCRDHPVEVRFIEYMPFDGNRWNRQKLVSYQEMRAIIEAKIPLLKLTDHENDTSKTFQPEGFRGRVGFITSLTDNFCGTCNRLRVTADGSLKVCLFGNSEVSLRDLIRQNNNGLPIESMELLEARDIADNERSLLEVIGTAVKRKQPKHAGIGKLKKMENRPMILIGG